MAPEAATSRCPMCRGTVRVEARYGQGDQLGCDGCGVLLKVIRTGGLKLVVADPTKLRDELQAVQQRLRAAQGELTKARASFGIGANGLGLGLLYVVARVGLEELDFSRELMWEGIGLAIATGTLLEMANFLFLAKRREMARLSAEMKEDEGHAKHLQQRLREALRG